MSIRRVYDPPASADGRRVLVDRVWPRGVRKDALELDEWLKDVAPSTQLRKWYAHDPDRFDEFTSRYREELSGGDAAAALAELRSVTGPLTLLTATKDLDLSHATVLRDLLAE
ncbi:DUF488 family protein [Labedaea rhizosphaerae]|uniref:DUF488 family protein, N3 subclade n=1 Tax=Labedaea rhizosphaerae TaxID=598644 RepID=UPI00105BE734